MDDNRVLGIAAIGVGAVGHLHARHLAYRVPGARLVAIVDIDRARAEAVAGECGSPRVATDYGDVLRDSAVDAVVISSPPDTHAQIIEEAADAGKHIFCEKPVDSDLVNAEHAIDATERAGVKLQIGFNRRFDVNFREVHDAVAAGKVGRPLIVHIISRDPKPPRLSSTRAIAGLFLDMTIHDFDMARYLTESDVLSVYAMAGTMLDGCGEPDTALISLRMANGVLVMIDNGHTVYGYDQRIEVFGTDGAVSAGNEQYHRASLIDREGEHSALPLHFFAERYGDSYAAELRAFVECVRTDSQPPVTGNDGQIAARIAVAAQRSYEERRPVTMSEERDS